ncbi:MAG: hypothetical protein RLZZ440_1499 [Planctomycetota bacterium]
MLLRLLVVALAIVGSSAAWAQPTVIDPGQGSVALSSGATAAAELSGITHVGGTTYQAVGDNAAATIWTLSISLDPASGWIGSAGVTGGIAAPALGTDSEGIAYRAASGTVFVSDEVASTIGEFSLTTGSLVGSVNVPAIYTPSNVQSNMGLESLAFGPGGLWTTNEEALVPDGPLSTTTAGSWVRIQRFDASLAAIRQWGYRTDPITALNPFISAERSGVVDILPWTETELLVLERELGGAVVPQFRSRLYLVDTDTASDVSALATINAGGFTPLSKTLLWERSFAASNFEGMTFGPTLNDGSRSLLLISDDGGGLAQNLYALAVVPEPSLAMLGSTAVAAGWLFVRRRSRLA